MTIKFDLDGTLIDMMEHTDRILADCGFTRQRPQRSYKVITDPKISYEYLWTVFRRVYDEWEDTLIFPGASELVNAVWDMTAEPIQIVTARPIYGAASAHRICEKLMGGIPYSISLVKNSDDKYLFMNTDDVLVEDRRKTVINISKIGLRSIILNQEYNFIINEFKYPGIIARVHSLYDILPILPELLG